MKNLWRRHKWRALAALWAFSLGISLVPLPVTTSGPTITNISAVVPCDTTTAISFRTLTASYARIEYGTTTGYGSSSRLDTSRFFTEHLAIAHGLTANTLYHFRVVATDASGTTTSSDQTFTTAVNGNSCPALPTLIDTQMPDMTGAVEQTVKNSGGTFTPAQFQTALNTARDATGKRIITVDAGITLTGQYILGNKVDSNWIIVRSSAHASLAEGKRVTPSDASLMFKITNNSTDAPIITASGAHHWRLIGVEVTIDASAMGADAPGGNNQSGLIRLGTAAETAESQWPHHITLDRMYVHGLPTKNTIRGVYNNGTDNAIIDSYFDEFHGTGNDSQAILHGEGRRLKIVNNALIAAGEPFMSGGIQFNVVPITTPSDIEFTHNYTEWKLKWKNNDPSSDGIDWVTKNHWESKNGKRYLVAFSVFNRWWFSEQTGGSIAIKSSNDEKDATVVSSDITWFRNHHKNIGSGFSINGSSWSDELSTDYTRRVWVMQNLLEIDGDTWGDEDSSNDAFAAAFFINPSVRNSRNVSDLTTTNGSAIVTSPTASFTATDVGISVKLVQASPGSGVIETIISSVQGATQATLATNVTWSASSNTALSVFEHHYPDDLRIYHNTFTNGAGDPRQIYRLGGAPNIVTGKMDNHIFRDNVVGYGSFGIKADGVGEGTVSLDAVSTSATRTFSTNLIAGSSSGYPTGNTYVANFTAVDFVNFNNGLDGNYRLAATSPGKNTASDGLDMGVDNDALARGVLNTESGNWAATLVSNTLTIYSANLQHGRGTDNSFNFQRQIDEFDDADIIAVQERTTGETGWNGPMSSAGLVQAVHLENSPTESDGPAIWYKSSTVTVDQIYTRALNTGTNPSCGVPNVGFDCTTDVRKSAVAAKVTVASRQFYVVSVHGCWSRCNNSSSTTVSVQRENQISDLVNWINTTLTGGLDVVILGDMNFGPDYAKSTGGLIKDLLTANYTDLWNAGITASVATAPWNDRDGVGGADMPVADLTTRTHDTRRIDYIFLKTGASVLSLSSITVPDGRSTCPHALVAGGVFPSCSPEVTGGPGVSGMQWDIPDDFGVRPSDHNFVRAVLTISSSFTICNWNSTPRCQQQ